MGSTVREMQRHQARARERERYVEDTQRELNKQKFFEVSQNAVDKASEKRMARLIAQQQMETEMEEAVLFAEQQRRIKECQLDQEERLAEELKRIKLEQIRDEKMRQQIRENSQELRELEAKLRAGYMNKERSAQVAEKEAIRYEELAREAAILNHMKEEAARAQELEAQKAQERYAEMIKYQADLEKQLAEREHQKQSSYEEFLRDKLMIDEIVRKIYEEDQREKERELLKRKATQEFIHEFKRQQKAFREAEQQRMDEENRRLAQYAAEMQHREVQAVAEKKEKDETRDRLQKALGDEVQRKEREREELEAIRQELYVEEQEERARKEEKESIEKRIRDRLMLQADYEEQLRLKEVRKLSEKEEEERLRRELLAKFAEDERIEQLTAERRRQKQAEHRKRVEELLEARRQRLAAEKEQELAEMREQAELERMRKKIIEEERLKLLREHAAKLIGFLPKGVIRDAQEAERVGAEFNDEWTRRSAARHAPEELSDARIDRDLPPENTYAYRRLMKKY